MEKPNRLLHEPTVDYPREGELLVWKEGFIVKATFLPDGTQTWFLVEDLDPSLYTAAERLGYKPTPKGGHGRAFPSDTPHLDVIYANFAASVEPLILQKAGRLPVPWEEALEAFLQRVSAFPINWWLTGSSALAVCGIPITPGDIDIVTSTISDGLRLDQIFQESITEPVHSSWVANRVTRTFLGARVGWIADLKQEHAAEAGLLEAGQHLQRVTWHKYTILVPPPKLQLTMNERRGRTDRVEYIREWLRQRQAAEGSQVSRT
jgi:hypothetical protein